MSIETISVYGAKVIYEHLSAMQAEVEGVLRGDDLEYIHRMRVATRRLRSAFKIFKDSFPKEDYKLFNKDIRAVTRALGAARDLDVQLELIHELQPKFTDQKLKPGLARLQLRLKQQRQQAQRQVSAAMERLEKDETLRRIARWAAPWLDHMESENVSNSALYELANSKIQGSLEKMMSFDKVVREETNIAELHAMRISIKRLRYMLEAFERLYGEQIKPFINQTKKIQDLLGSIHDADVWMEMIPNFIQEEGQRIEAYFGHRRPLRRLLPGLQAFAADRKRIRDEEYQSFIKVWDQSLESGLWDQLVSQVRNPFEEQFGIKPASRLIFYSSTFRSCSIRFKKK